MKTIYTIILLIVACTISNAQTFKPFKVIIGAGYALPSGNSVKGGLITFLDAQYALNDKVALGFSTGTANIGPDSFSFDNQYQQFLGDVNTYYATGSYYFNTNTIRPFISMGAGLATVHIYGTNEIGSEIVHNKSNVFAVIPGIGIERSHIQLLAEYTLIGKTESIKSSYLGLKLGFFFGGGRK